MLQLTLRHNTARFSVKSKYAAPTTSAPWPFSLASRFTLSIQWDDVTLQFAPDTNMPTPDTHEATAYRVTKLTAPKRVPRSRILAAVYHVA